MKTLLALVALILIPAAALAADAPAEPKIYEDTVLKIKFYDVADLRKYKGADKQLLKLGSALKRSKIDAGVVLINRIENITDNTYGMAKQYACVVTLGKKAIRDHADVEAFTKTAKAGEEYALKYSGFDSTGSGKYSESIQENKFEIKP